jgi:hypothetical protein
MDESLPGVILNCDLGLVICRFCKVPIQPIFSLIQFHQRKLHNIVIYDFQSSIFTTFISLYYRSKHTLISAIKGKKLIAIENIRSIKGKMCPLCTFSTCSLLQIKNHKTNIHPYADWDSFLITLKDVQIQTFFPNWTNFPVYNNNTEGAVKLLIEHTDTYDQTLLNEIDYSGDIDQFTNDFISMDQPDTKTVNDLSSLTKVEFDDVWYPSKAVFRAVDSCDPLLITPVIPEVIESPITVPMELEFMEQFPDVNKTLNGTYI